MKTIEIFKIRYTDINMSEDIVPMVRGYFANKYIEIDNMHNHDGDKYIYRYPDIQYKIIEDNPVIIGINQGANILKNKNIFNEDTIKIGNREITSTQRKIVSKNAQIGISKDIKKYKFITPWVSLNQKNIKKYNKADIIEKNDLLEKIIIGNILSLSKGLNYTVEEEIRVKLELEEIKVNLKGIDMIGFKGYFYVNFEIPNDLGIGKSISRGFGTVKKVG